MKIEDLLLSIKSQMEDLEINISDLKSPTPRFVQNYIKRLVMDFGIDPSREISMSQEECDEFTAFNSVKPVLPLFGLFAAAEYLGNFSSEFDFGLSDLTRPSPQRTQHLLETYIWFYNYADYKAQQAQDERHKMLHEKKRLEQLKAEVEKMKENITNENEEYSLIGVLKKEKEEDNNMNVQLKKQLDEEEEENAEISVEVEKLNARYSKLISKYTKLEDHLKPIQSQLVLSPEIDNLESKLKDANEKNEANQKKKPYFGDLITKKSQQCTMIEKCIPAVKQSKENLQTQFERLKKHEMLHEELETIQGKQTTKSKEIQDLMDQKPKRRNKLDQLSHQHMAKETTLEENKSSYKMKIQATENDLNMIMNQKEEAQLHIEEVDFRNLEKEEEILRLVELNDKTCEKGDTMFKEKSAKDIAELKRMGLL